jgi:hypothetical protein
VTGTHKHRTITVKIEKIILTPEEREEKFTCDL